MTNYPSTLLHSLQMQHPNNPRSRRFPGHRFSTVRQLALITLSGVIQTAIIALFFACSASAIAAPAREISSEPNLIKNSDFRRGLESWQLQSDPPANTKTEWLSAESGPPGISGKVARLEVTALGTKNYNIQFSQANLDLVDGEPYTLTFWARADRARNMGVAMALDRPDWHTVGLWVNHLALTRDWRRSTFVFTAARSQREHNRLSFVLGDSLGSVELAGIWLRHGSAGIPSGPNLLESADFTTPAEDWSLQTSDSANAKLEWQNPTSETPAASGQIAHLSITTLGSQNWNVQLVRSGLDLEEGEPYTLTFWARANRERSLGVSMGLDVPDWHPVGLDFQTTIKPEWNKIVLAFTATQTVKDHNRLLFVLGDALGTVDLAGMSLQHIVHSAPPQTAPPTQSASTASRSLIGTWESRSGDPSRKYHLVFNADGTGSISVGTTASKSSEAPPKAPVSNAFRWYLKEANRNIVIGTKVFTWSISSSGANKILILIDRNGVSHEFLKTVVSGQ